MMTKIKPADFNKRSDVVGCFIEHDDKFLLLRRHEQESHGQKWGLPAGKVEEGENIMLAMLREIEEETGLNIPADTIVQFDSLFVRNNEFDFEWHMFSTKLDILPIININPSEHTEFRWVNFEEALSMDLIHDLAESIQMYYQNVT